MNKTKPKVRKKSVVKKVNTKKPKCKKCNDVMGIVICPCEVASKYGQEYEDWRDK